jgi:hypothetical protein
MVEEEGKSREISASSSSGFVQGNVCMLRLCA